MAEPQDYFHHAVCKIILSAYLSTDFKKLTKIIMVIKSRFNCHATFYSVKICAHFRIQLMCMFCKAYKIKINLRDAQTVNCVFSQYCTYVHRSRKGRKHRRGTTYNRFLCAQVIGVLFFFSFFFQFLFFFWLCVVFHIPSFKYEEQQRKMTGWQLTPRLINSFFFSKCSRNFPVQRQQLTLPKPYFRSISDDKGKNEARYHPVYATKISRGTNQPKSAPHQRWFPSHLICTDPS